MNEDIVVINRFGEPSAQDITPYGSVCIVKNNSQTKTLLYIQLSRNEQSAQWTPFAECDEDITQEEIINKRKRFMYISNVS